MGPVAVGADRCILVILRRLDTVGALVVEVHQYTPCKLSKFSENVEAKLALNKLDNSTMFGILQSL